MRYFELSTSYHSIMVFSIRCENFQKYSMLFSEYYLLYVKGAEVTLWTAVIQLNAFIKCFQFFLPGARKKIINILDFFLDRVGKNWKQSCIWCVGAYHRNKQSRWTLRFTFLPSPFPVCMFFKFYVVQFVWVYILAWKLQNSTSILQWYLFYFYCLFILLREWKKYLFWKIWRKRKMVGDEIII